MQTKYYNEKQELIKFVIDGVEQPLDGLGTRIEQIAQPIARAIDKAAGTNISGCGGCKQMRDRLNSGMTIPEAIEARLIEFALRRLSRRRSKIFERIKARLDRRVS